MTHFMDDSGRSDGVPRNVRDSFCSPGSYQPPLFSLQEDHGNHQRLEPCHVYSSPRYITSLPADQNRTIDSTVLQATLYQLGASPLGHTSHFSPHASQGDSVDGFSLLPPPRAQPHAISQQMPPRYPYPQASSITGPPTIYDFQGHYDTASYGPPIPPHYTQARVPVTFDFSGYYNTLPHGPPIPPHYPYAQASTTIGGSSFLYNFSGCPDTVSHGPPMPPHYLYTQGSPTIGAPLSHNVPGFHNTGVSRDFLGQYNTQSVQSFLPVQPVQGSRVDPMDLTQALHVAPLPPQSGDTNASPEPKKCVRHYPCPASDCPTFRRPQDLRQHLSTHLPHWVNCPDPGCSWRGDRLSVFRKHWGSNHHPSSGQDLDEDQFITYDPWPFVEKIKEGSLSIEEAQKQAMAMVSKKASELHKPELRENPWGRKRRRKPQKSG